MSIANRCLKTWDDNYISYRVDQYIYEHPAGSLVFDMWVNAQMQAEENDDSLLDALILFIRCLDAEGIQHNFPE